MKYIEVKNLEKYHPGYKDRSLIWCKMYFSMLNGDPEFEMLCEIDQLRFIKFIMLQIQTKGPIPLDAIYLTRKGFDFKKRSINLTLNMLHNFIIVSEHDSEIASRRVEKSRVELEEIRIEQSETRTAGPSHQQAVDYFCDKYFAKVGTKYVFKGFQDGAIISSILKALPHVPYCLKNNTIFQRSMFVILLMTIMAKTMATKIIGHLPAIRGQETTPACSAVSSSNDMSRFHAHTSYFTVLALIVSLCFNYSSPKSIK